MKKLGMKKVWVPVIALCSVGLIVGTGYAAWTIALNQSGETSGNRKADTVVDNHIKVTGVQWYTGVSDNGSAVNDANKVPDNKPVVCFGWADQDPAVENPWLTKGENAFKENRKFTLYFEVEKGTGLKGKTLNVTAALDVNDTSAKVYEECTKGEKPLLVTPDNLEPKTLGTATNGNEKYYVNVEWKWGSAFAGKNPYVYYNSQSEAAADASGAATNLEKLSKLNTSTTTEGIDKDKPNFKVTITVTESN